LYSAKDKDFTGEGENFRNAEPASGKDRVLIPGDPERDLSIERRKNGIPLHEQVVTDLSDLGNKFGLTFNNSSESN
jgi:LDH2 family malate/lactate/ureidoglycolate dehydrogenase